MPFIYAILVAIFFSAAATWAGPEAQTCDGKRPHEAALIYLRNMRDFTKHLPRQISDVTSDMGDTALLRGLIDLDARLKLPSGERGSAERALILAISMLPGGEVFGPLVYFGDFITPKRAPFFDPSEVEYATVAGQLKGIADYRDQVNEALAEVEDSITHIIEAQENPDGMAARLLKKEEHELLRRTVCRFIPDIMTKGYSNRAYDDYCDFQKDGGKNFTRNRGTLTCDHVVALDSANRKTEYRRIKAQFARALVSNIVMADPLRLRPEGTTGRIELLDKCGDCILNGSFIGSPHRKLDARMPGGKKLVCTLLEDPKYDRYWFMKNGRRTLHPGLPLKELGLPIAIEVRKGNVKYPDIERYQLDEKGRPEAISINNHPAHRDSSSHKYIARKSAPYLYVSVRDLVGDFCDR